MKEAELRDKLCGLLPTGCQATISLNGSLATITIERQGLKRKATIPTRKLDAEPDLMLDDAVSFLLQRLDLTTHRGEDHWAPSGAIWTHIRRIR